MLLPECESDVAYAPNPRQTQTVARTLLTTETELQQYLPLNWKSEAERLRTYGTLGFEPKVEGSLNAAAPSRAQLRGTCEGASHYVSAALIGSLEPMADDFHRAPSDTPVQSGELLPVRGDVIALFLDELKPEQLVEQPTPITCRADERWDGARCVACPIGMRWSTNGCAPTPVDNYPSADEKLLHLLSRAKTPLDRAHVLYMIFAHSSDDELRAAAAANLADDQALSHACMAGEEPKGCEEVSEALAGYAQLLRRRGSEQTATDIELQLIREHPKSPNSAPAFKAAADQLCAEGDRSGAQRLYNYIRVNFPRTEIAKGLPEVPCPPAPEGRTAD